MKKKMNPFLKGCRSQRGFSLPEVMLALAIFAFVMVANFGLFGLSLKTIRDGTDRDEAVRSVSAFQDVLKKQPFATVFTWAKNGNATVLFAYNYKGALNNPLRTDGTMDCYTTAGGVLGTDYVVVPGLRADSDPLLLNDLAVREGSLYRLIIDASKGNPIPKLSLTSLTNLTYTAGTLAIYVKFYEVGNVTAAVNTSKPPIYSCTMSYLR